MKFLKSVAIFLFMLPLSLFAQNGSGVFIQLKESGGTPFRAYVAGPEKALAGVMVVHDFFGISDATKASVERLGALGYHAVAVDLYSGQSATTDAEATKLMNALDTQLAGRIMQAGIDYLKHSSCSIGLMGFSMGGLQAINAQLNDPQAISATVLVYGGSFDSIDPARLITLSSPILTVAGSKDAWAASSAINFLSIMGKLGLPSEVYLYPNADHGYAQPLFHAGANYNAEATRVTWLLAEDFLDRHLTRHGKKD